jgi:phosphoribosylaminoimidazole (AIR) synthetase
MGMGLGVIAEEKDCEKIIEIFGSAGFRAQLVGELTDEAGTIRISGLDFVLRDKLS